MSQSQESKISGDDIRKITEKFYEDFCAKINQEITEIFQSDDFWEEIKEVASRGYSEDTIELANIPKYDNKTSHRLVTYFNLYHAQERDGLTITLGYKKYIRLKVSWKFFEWKEQTSSQAGQEKFSAQSREIYKEEKFFAQECQRILREIIDEVLETISSEEFQQNIRDEELAGEDSYYIRISDVTIDPRFDPRDTLDFLNKNIGKINGFSVQIGMDYDASYEAVLKIATNS